MEALLREILAGKGFSRHGRDQTFATDVTLMAELWDSLTEQIALIRSTEGDGVIILLCAGPKNADGMREGMICGVYPGNCTRWCLQESTTRFAGFPSVGEVEEHVSDNVMETCLKSMVDAFTGESIV